MRIPALRAAAVATFALLAASHPARAADVWQPLGPDGGNVASLAVDPQDGNTVYAGTLHAGVYRSGNGGRSWQPAGLYGGISRLAVAPNRVVYAVVAQTLFRSHDRGASWVSLAPGLAALGKPQVQSLALSPTLGTLFVVAGTGYLDREVLRSTDGGNSWTAIFHSPTLAILSRVWTDPTDPQLVFAATAFELYVSADGGARWALTGLPRETLALSEASLAIEVGPRHRILAFRNVAVTRITVVSSVALSSDRGRTWRARDLPGRPPLALLSADPTAPGAFFAVGGGMLFRTTDAGLHWTSLGRTPYDATSGGGTPRDLAFDPHRPGIAFLAVPGGNFGRTVWKTATFGAAWTPFNRGLFAGEFLSATVDLRDPAILWAAGGGSDGSPAGLFKSSDRGATWAAAGFNTEVVFGFTIAGRGHSLFALRQTEVARSDDGGQSWTKAAFPADLVDVFVSPPEEPDTFYVLGTHTYVPELEVSLGGGATWTNRPLAANVLTVAPGRPATLYANTTTDSVAGTPGEDGVQRSDDRGATWTTILHVTGGSVGSIGVDPADPRRVVVAHFRLTPSGLPASEVLWTADAGATWSPVVFPPEVRFLGRFLPDPLIPHGLLVGTDAGAFASADGGATWTRVGDGLPQAFSQLSLDPASPSTVYAATQGGGIYRLERTEP